MEDVIKLAGLCLVVAVFTVLVKKHSPEMSILLVIALCVAALFAIVGAMEEITSFLQEVYVWGNLPQELFAPLIKTTGIALISHTGAELCRDAEQKTMAFLLELAGTFAAVLVALPLFERVWDMLRQLL